MAALASRGKSSGKRNFMYLLDAIEALLGFDSLLLGSVLARMVGPVKSAAADTDQAAISAIPLGRCVGGDHLSPGGLSGR